MQTDEQPIRGWGVDRRIEDRPGYPLEQQRWPDHDVRAGLPPYAPTVPLRGLSGVIRRRAYRLPDWKPRRWLLLMLGDRVDAFESRLTPLHVVIAGGVISLAAGASMWWRPRR